MHAVKCHTETGKRCNPGLFRQLFAEKIHPGQHQDSGQCSGKTPSERCHPEKSHKSTHQHFPERRMTGFVRNASLQEFKSGPCVINLIKIGTVPPSRLSRSVLRCFITEVLRQFFKRILLVNQSLRVGIQFGFSNRTCPSGNHGRDIVSLCIPEYDLVQCQAQALCSQSDITSVQVYDMVKIGIVVGSAGCCPRIGFGQVFPFPALTLVHLCPVFF